MKQTLTNLILIVPFFFFCGEKVWAQNMYPNLSPLEYYNMDTGAILLEGNSYFKTTYTREELDKILSEPFDADSILQLTSYKEVPCTKIGNITLPLRDFKEKELLRIVDEIIGETVEKRGSPSPDSLISRGFLIYISFYKDRHTPPRPIIMNMEVLSNYYMGSIYKNIRKNFSDSNIFCCYHQGILGVVTFSNDIEGNSINHFFSESIQNITLHLYQKKRQKIITESNLSNKDVHSTNYGLYRRYMRKRGVWVERY